MSFVCPVSGCTSPSEVLETRWKKVKQWKKRAKDNFTLVRTRRCANGHKFLTHELVLEIK